MSEKDKQKQRKYVKEHRRNKSRNVLKKIKENNQLKSVKVNVVTNFIKYKVEIVSNDHADADDNKQDDTI